MEDFLSNINLTYLIGGLVVIGIIFYLTKKIISILFTLAIVLSLFGYSSLADTLNPINIVKNYNVGYNNNEVALSPKDGKGTPQVFSVADRGDKVELSNNDKKIKISKERFQKIVQNME